MFEDELKELYVEAKRSAMEGFSQVAVGEIRDEFLSQLKQKIRHKFNIVKSDNEKMAEVRFQIYFAKNDDNLLRS